MDNPDNINLFTAIKSLYLIKGRINLDTALSIGGGSIENPLDTDNLVIRDGNYQPFIPGSSLKGVIRTFIERILRTLEVQKVFIGKTQLRACDPIDQNKKCLTNSTIDKLKRDCVTDTEFDDLKYSNMLWNNMCPACRLFGSGEFASRIRFTDAYLTNPEIPALTERRDGVAINRDSGTAGSGLKYDYEVVTRKQEFLFELEMENIEQWEFGLINFALKNLNNHLIAIGGKTSKGFGKIMLKDLQYTVKSSSDFESLTKIFEDEIYSPLNLDEQIQSFRNQLLQQ